MTFFRRKRLVQWQFWKVVFVDGISGIRGLVDGIS
jgi:hypothetical protein